LRAAIRQDKVC